MLASPRMSHTPRPCSCTGFSPPLVMQLQPALIRSPPALPSLLWSSCGLVSFEMKTHNDARPSIHERWSKRFCVRLPPLSRRVTQNASAALTHLKVTVTVGWAFGASFLYAGSFLNASISPNDCTRSRLRRADCYSP